MSKRRRNSEQLMAIHKRIDEMEEAIDDPNITEEEWSDLDSGLYNLYEDAANIQPIDKAYIARCQHLGIG